MSFPVREIKKSRGFVFFFVTRHFTKAFCQGMHFANALCQDTLSRHFAKAAFCKGMHFVKALCQSTLPGQHFVVAALCICQGNTLSMHAGTLPRQADTLLLPRQVLRSFFTVSKLWRPPVLTSFNFSLLYQNYDIVLRSFFTVPKFQGDLSLLYQNCDIVLRSFFTVTTNLHSWHLNIAFWGHSAAMRTTVTPCVVVCRCSRHALYFLKFLKFSETEG